MRLQPFSRKTQNSVHFRPKNSPPNPITAHPQPRFFQVLDLSRMHYSPFKNIGCNPNILHSQPQTAILAHKRVCILGMFFQKITPPHRIPVLLGELRDKTSSMSIPHLRGMPALGGAFWGPRNAGCSWKFVISERPQH